VRRCIASSEARGRVALLDDVAPNRRVVAEQPIEQGRLAERAVVGQDEALLVGRGATLGLELMSESQGREVLLEAARGADPRDDRAFARRIAVE
jgi:hypothetical protein